MVDFQYDSNLHKVSTVFQPMQTLNENVQQVIVLKHFRKYITGIELMKLIITE